MTFLSTSMKIQWKPVRLQRSRFTRLFAYTVTYSVAPINSSPLTRTLNSSVITTLGYNDTRL